jgi:hypothetical protein
MEPKAGVGNVADVEGSTLASVGMAEVGFGVDAVVGADDGGTGAEDFKELMSMMFPSRSLIMGLFLSGTTSGSTGCYKFNPQNPHCRDETTMRRCDRLDERKL